MRKGFLLGPVTSTPKKEAVKNKDEEAKEKQDKAVTAPPKTAPEEAPKVAEAQALPTPEKRIPGKKRRRTRSHNPSLSPSPGRGFVVPGFNSVSGAQTQMSMAELMDASKGITNMALAHEIAVDKDFTLQKLSPENGLERQVKEILHKAFWEILREELESEPPQYKQALVLLTEVRGMLISLLLPHHGKLKDKIEEVLDVELIKQQIDTGVLEFEKYAGYIIGLMSMLCAPVRDEQIQALKTQTKVVDIFKGIIETLELMKIDMANFTIQQARPLIVSKSVEYEKLKFQEFLATVDDGLVATRQWLVRHAPSQEEIEDPKYKKLLGARVLNEAFTEILEWDDYYDLPETLTMDGRRIVALRDQVERASVSTAVILLTFSSINTYVIPQDSQKLKEKMKQHVDILLQDFFEDQDLLRILPSVGLQVVKDVNTYLEEKSRPLLPSDLAKSLCDQIESLEDPNHRIRDLVQKRIVDFNKQIISGNMKNGMQIPPGLTLCQKELGSIAGQFVRLVNYNKQVFGDIYTEIINNHCLFRA